MASLGDAADGLASARSKVPNFILLVHCGEAFITAVPLAFSCLFGYLFLFLVCFFAVHKANVLHEVVGPHLLLAVLARYDLVLPRSFFLPMAVLPWFEVPSVRFNLFHSNIL